MTILYRPEGIHPVLYSFFGEDDALRYDGFEQQVEWCLKEGAAGIVLFGFVTQFYRLTNAEKREAMRVCAAALGGRAPFAVTVMEPSVAAQIELVRAAEAAGAGWVILQPPLGPPSLPARWLEGLVTVAAATSLPVAVQNAPIAGTTLSNAELVALQERAPNVTICKAETGAVDVAAFAREEGERFSVMTGNWGVEYPYFRANGAHGLIPAPNFVGEQVALHRASDPAAPDLDETDRIHAAILPLMQFLREREPPEGQILLGRYAYQRRTGYAAGGNRLPGPLAIDPALTRHVDRLCERLWG